MNCSQHEKPNNAMYLTIFTLFIYYEIYTLKNILQYKYKIGTGYLVPRKGTIVLKLTLQCAQQTQIRHFS